MKRNVLVILIIAVCFSTLSVVTMIRSSKNQSFQSFASNLECSAQGNFKPEPFDNILIAPISGADEPICSIQTENQTEKTN